MKRFTLFAIVFVLLSLCLIPNASAIVDPTLIVKQPNPSDLNDLDHGQYYIWGMDINLTANQRITYAEIFIDDINNWAVETDALYIHLLSSATVGTQARSDTTSGDQFTSTATPNILLDTYTDLYDDPGPSEDYQHIFNTAELNTLNQYLSDKNFGIGFDSDCHYYNTGIYFKYQKQCVPEPATVMLLMPALLGMLGFRRKK
jgi:hypothetical protein